MRFSYVFLVIVTTLLATADAGTRSLRGNKKIQDEERAFSYTFKFNLWDDIFHSLPEQFQRMRTQPEYLRQMLHSWRSGMGTPEEAVIYMKSQGLNQKAIDQFEDAFKSYLAHNRGKH